MDHLVVVAHIYPKPEYFDDAVAAIEAIIPSTLNEPGCRGFSLHAEVGHCGLCLIEEFADEAAFEHHHEQSYTQAVFDRYERWLARPVEVFKLRRLM